jgi:hypothetical protein
MSTYGNVTRGLKDLKVAPYPTGAAVDVGAAIEATVEDRVDYGELKGDDAIVEIASNIEGATLKFSAGGITPEAVAIITGKVVTESGTTPTQYKTMPTLAARFPYFRLFGLSLDSLTGDKHVLVYHCKLTKFASGVLKNGEFQMTDAEGVCTPDPASPYKIYDIIFHETSVALPAS